MMIKELTKDICNLLKQANWRQLRLVYTFTKALLGDTSIKEDAA